MKHVKGAAAPFSFTHFSLCNPLQRDDALLAHSLDALSAGFFADALIAVEYVCRRHPGKSMPAILRARILESCRPELVAKAWYQAWVCDPENPMIQDNLLRSWLDAHAFSAVRDLGAAFLPARCRSGNQGSLLALLAQAGMVRVGACWAVNHHIEGMVFQLNPSSQTAPNPSQTSLPPMRLMMFDQTTQLPSEIVQT